jgi:hypothetical protein
MTEEVAACKKSGEESGVGFLGMIKKSHFN